MKPSLLKAYRAMRAAHPCLNAATLLHWARTTMKAKTLDWSDNRAQWKEGKFTFIATREDDDDADLSWIGKLTDDPDGAIKRHNAGSNEYQYFKPTNSYREHYKGLRKLKYGRAEADRLARSYVQQDMRRMERYGESWTMTGVRVRCYAKGIELASASLWGIESDSEESYFTEVALENAHEAKREAEKKIELMESLARVQRAVTKKGR